MHLLAVGCYCAFSWIDVALPVEDETCSGVVECNCVDNAVGHDVRPSVNSVPIDLTFWYEAFPDSSDLRNSQSAPKLTFASSLGVQPP